MDNHIINLLKTNNRVIIPEFGAFIVKSGSPRTIVFNEFLKYNDEVLLKEISKAENISEDEATKKLDEFTRELNSQLDLGQQHKMGSMGILSKDNNGRIHFQMLEGADMLENAEEPEKKESEKVEMKEPVLAKEVAAEIKSQNEPFEIGKETEIKKEPAATNKEEKPLIDAPQRDNLKKENEPEKKLISSSVNDKQDKKKPLTVNEKLQPRGIKPVEAPKREQQKKEKAPFTTYMSKNKNTVWYILVAVVLVAIIGWFLAANKEYIFNLSDSKKTAEADEVVIKPEETENLSDEDVNSTVVGATGEEKDESTELPKEEVKEPVKSRPDINNSQPGVKRYYIVAGCFQQESNADNYVDYLNGQGYNSKKFGKYGGLFAVSFDSFDSFSDAQKELNKIKKSTEPEAWILYY